MDNYRYCAYCRSDALGLYASAYQQQLMMSQKYYQYIQYIQYYQYQLYQQQALAHQSQYGHPGYPSSPYSAAKAQMDKNPYGSQQFDKTYQNPYDKDKRLALPAQTGEKNYYGPKEDIHSNAVAKNEQVHSDVKNANENLSKGYTVDHDVEPEPKVSADIYKNMPEIPVGASEDYEPLADNTSWEEEDEAEEIVVLGKPLEEEAALEVICFKCKGSIPIYTDERPLLITCPHCGQEGEID